MIYKYNIHYNDIYALVNYSSYDVATKRKKQLWFLEPATARQSKLTFFALTYPQLYFNPVLIYTNNKVKSKEGKRRNGFAIIFLFTSKIKTYFITFSLFEERIYYLNSFSWQQLAIIRQKNRTFAYRKRGELLDGKLCFSMTQENERWNGKNGHFLYRGTSKKRFSTVLSVRLS